MSVAKSYLFGIDFKKDDGVTRGCIDQGGGIGYAKL